MNRREVGIFVGGLVAGLAAGIPIGTVLLDKKVRKEYDHSIDTMRASYEHALNNPTEVPVSEESELLEEIAEGVNKIADGMSYADLSLPEVFETTEEKHLPKVQNPYHTAVEASANPNSFRVADTPTHIEYIEAEEYEEDDDRVKHKLVMLKAELGLPMMFLDGSATDDWDLHVGEDILAVYHRLMPNGEGAIFVRNHQRDEDYEVSMEMP